MNRKNIALKTVLYVIFLLLLYFFQSAVFSRIRIFGVKPLFIPLVPVCVGMFEGNLLGGVIGLVCGLLCDFCMSDTTVLFTVFLTAVGFLIGYLAETVIVRSFSSCLVCSAVILLLTAFLQSFELLFFAGADVMAVIRVSLLQTGYSILFILPIYWCVRAIRRSVKI